jgi:hypothetical protein
MVMWENPSRRVRSVAEHASGKDDINTHPPQTGIITHDSSS